MGLSDLLQDCSNKTDTAWYSNIVTALCCQSCNKLATTGLYQSCKNNLVTSLIFSSSLEQLVDNLVQAVRAHLVEGLSADLLQVVRFLSV